MRVASPVTPPTSRSASSFNSSPAVTTRQSKANRFKLPGTSSPNATPCYDPNKIYHGKIIRCRKKWGFIACPELNCILFVREKHIQRHKSENRSLQLSSGLDVEFQIVDGKPNLEVRNVTGPGGKFLAPNDSRSQKSKKKQVRMTRGQHAHSYPRPPATSSSV